MILTQQQDRHHHAFTLMELLIAVAIFGIVLAAINTVFFAGLRLRNRFTTSFDQQLPVLRTIDVIKQDLSSLVAPSTNATAESTNITFFGPLTSGVTTSGGVGNASSAGGQTLGAAPSTTEFYVSSGRISETLPWGDMQKVSYVLMESTNQAQTEAVGRDLMRSVSRNLAPASTDDQPELEWLMSGVEAINFSYYDGSAWADTWDTSTVSLTTSLSNTLPRAIKVQIVMATERDQPVKAPIEVLVPIYVQFRTNLTSTTNSY